jgi:lipopolysaccharide export system protein LptA
LCCVGICNQGLSASNKKPETPTRIRSDIIDIKRKSQIVDFLGNVVVEKDDSSLLAQKMRVIYEEKKDKKKAVKTDLESREENPKKESGKQTEKQTKIKRIDATENVKIFSDEFIASGDIGYYEPEKDTFTLEKNVIVNNGTSIGSGDKFIYHLKSKKGNFVGRKDETSITGNGGDKRVVVVIGDDLQKNKNQKKHDKKKNEQNPKR